MASKVLIDMIKLREFLSRNPEETLPEGLFYPYLNINGLKTIRELAIFRYTCRRCKEAPCIDVCPSDALEKDETGIITRHTNLCVSCKSCVTICPFGTIMTDFFTHQRNRDLLYDLNDEKELKKFVEASPEGTVIITDAGESPEKNIYSLNDRILIREYMYPSEKE